MKKQIAQTYRDEYKQEQLAAKGDEMHLTDVPSIKKYMTAAKDIMQRIKTDQVHNIDENLKQKLLDMKEYKLNLPYFSMRPLVDERKLEQ